jgi:hypothetical protein
VRFLAIEVQRAFHPLLHSQVVGSVVGAVRLAGSISFCTAIAIPILRTILLALEPVQVVVGAPGRTI